MASGSSNDGHAHLQIEVAEMRRTGLFITKISEITGGSRNTLYRVLEDGNLIGVTDISDQELDEIMASYKETHPSD